MVSTENPSLPSKESHSNPGLSQGQETKWGISFGTVTVSPNWCLLVPRKRRDVLSVGSGPRRASLQFLRLKSTVHPLQVSQFPAGGLLPRTQTASSPTLSLLSSASLTSPWFACNGFLLLKYSPLSSPHWGSNIISFNKPRLSEAKEETGSFLVDAWQFLLLTCNPKVPELREHKCLTTLWW